MARPIVRQSLAFLRVQRPRAASHRTIASCQRWRNGQMRSD